MKLNLLLLKNSCLQYFISGPQTFPVRRPLGITWCSAKQKILIFTEIRGPLQLISRTTGGLRSRPWESLVYLLKNWRWQGDTANLRGRNFDACLSLRTETNEVSMCHQDFVDLGIQIIANLNSVITRLTAL
jgi:hypothetical protein